MVVKKLNNPDKSIGNEIREKLLEKAKDNDDGFYFRNAGGELKTLDLKNARNQITKVELNNLMTHFRWATTGKVSKDNVHGWTIGDWLFMHNGTVSNYAEDYTTKYKQEHTDSYLFFKDLSLFLSMVNPKKDEQVAEAIQSSLDDSDFYGRAVLYNKTTDKMYLFGDFHIYTLADSYLVISSQILDFEQKTEYDVHGINIGFTQDKVVGEATVDGIGVITNFSKDNFSYRLITEIKTTFTPPSNGYFDYSSKEWVDYDDLTPKKTLQESKKKLEQKEIDKEIKETISKEVKTGFVGFTAEGLECYRDETGIHDTFRSCCSTGECKDGLKVYFKKPDTNIREELMIN